MVECRSNHPNPKAANTLSHQTCRIRFVCAASDGDEVVIAPELYTGVDNRDLDFGGKAITVRSTDPNDPDVDVFDFADFLGCVTGPAGGGYSPGCEAFDFESDDDVDAADLGGFQLVFSGSP